MKAPLIIAVIVATSPAVAQSPRFLQGDDWAVRPGPEEFRAVAPQGPTTGGEGMLQCQIAAGGQLQDCTVLSESPQGLGYGEAALRLSSSHRVKQGAGAPEVGEVVRARIMIRPTVMQRPRFLQTPSSQQISDVYPSSAHRRGLSGTANLRCLVRQTGEVGDCEIIDESPANQGFGRAALRLTRYFRLEPQSPVHWPDLPQAEPWEDIPINLPIQFRTR